MRKEQEENQFIAFLFDKNYNRIYEYCCLRLGKPFQDAEDCAMEVFSRAFRHVEDLMEHPCPERWLYVTARNISMEMLRRRMKYRYADSLDDLRPDRTSMYGAEDSAEDKFLKSCEERESAQLEKYLTGTLRPGELELYRLLVTKKRATVEIAEALGVSYTNATTKVYRLRKKLKKQVKLLKKGGIQNEENY